MTNRFFAGQTNYIEEMNALDGETGDHIADATGAHAATAISNTPAGNIAATTVQAAINELDTEKLSASATTLPASFTASSLTSVGTLTALTVSGQASFAAGSAAAPSVKVGAEQNGLYRSAANTLSVALGGLESFRFGYVASAVNYGQFAGNSAGGYPSLRAAGSDTNIGFDFATQGAAPFRFYTNAFGAEQFRVGHVASAVNQWAVQGGATGQSPFFFANGSDTNVSAGFSLKGAGNFSFYTGTTTATQLIITHTASTANAMTLTGSATGQPTRISNFGSDANPDILIAPQGTGVLRFGAHSAIAAETVTGYITIKDAAGNTRKLAVLS